jgi:alpha-glucosidase
VLGLARARAASTLMLALPGSSYLYQGEELGLPEVIDLPDEAREDPTWFRTNGERYGRDGCRVPLPWEAAAPSYGFGPTSASWLPQPAEWAHLARDVQRGTAGSTLELYTLALSLRREHLLGPGTVAWLGGFGPEIVAFVNGDVTVIGNAGAASVALPAGEVLLASGTVFTDADGVRTLPGDTTVWLRTA